MYDCVLIFRRKNGHATNTAVEIDGRRDGPREDEFEQDDDGKMICCFVKKQALPTWTLLTLEFHLTTRVFFPRWTSSCQLSENDEESRTDRSNIWRETHYWHKNIFHIFANKSVSLSVLSVLTWQDSCRQFHSEICFFF